VANDNLRQALQDAGLPPDELAGILHVDERTVRRWLGGGTPYARHRAKLARALDTTEHRLWPYLATSTPADATLAPAAAADTVAGYADAGAADTPSTEQLITDARERIDLLADTSRGLLEPPGLPELLLAKARDGCRVRILVCALDHRSLTPLLNTPGLEIRLSDGQERPVTHRIDDDTLAWMTLTTDEDARQPVLLHVRRDQAPGLFARLADHYQDAWKLSEPIETAGDIEHSLLEQDGDYDDPADDDDEDEDEDDEGDLAHDPGHTPQPDAQQPAASITRPAATAPRRWPGRPA
jgi:hypothetical protein